MKSNAYLLECCRAGYYAAANGDRCSPHINSSDADLAFRAGQWVFSRGFEPPQECAKGRGHRIKLARGIVLHFPSWQTRFAEPLPEYATLFAKGVA